MPRLSIVAAAPQDSYPLEATAQSPAAVTSLAAIAFATPDARTAINHSASNTPTNSKTKTEKALVASASAATTQERAGKSCSPPPVSPTQVDKGVVRLDHLWHEARRL